MRTSLPKAVQLCACIDGATCPEELLGTGATLFQIVHFFLWSRALWSLFSISCKNANCDREVAEIVEHTLCHCGQM